MLDTRGAIVAIGYTHRVSLFTILGEQVSTPFVLPLIQFKSGSCMSRTSLVSTATLYSISGLENRVFPDSSNSSGYSRRRLPETFRRLGWN